MAKCIVLCLRFFIDFLLPLPNTGIWITLGHGNKLPPTFSLMKQLVGGGELLPPLEAKFKNTNLVNRMIQKVFVFYSSS